MLIRLARDLNISMERNEIIAFLKQGPCELIFKKKNGSDRTMIATLKTELIPQNGLQGFQKVRKSNESIVSVFDLQKHAWRSFLLSNLTGIKKWDTRINQ